MKSEEAFEQISYIKEVLEKTRLRANEGYPLFLLGGILWFLGNMLAIFAPYLPWSDYLWIVYGVGSIVAAVTVIRRHRWPAVNARLLKQLAKQCLVILLSSVPVGILLFAIGAGWAFKVYIPFQVGVAYIVAGVFMGRDLRFIGLGLVAASALSLLLPYPLQDICLAVIGGGVLILTGIIFRNQVKKRG